MKNLIEKPLEATIFASRWLQAPMYVGLLAALLMYCYKFYEELYHLFHKLNELNSETMMISVLTMVDVTMVANLIVMVVIGGYETFVSKLHVNEHAHVET